ncbi:MAG: hypothetical protein JXA96_13185 [Sedimentisphaerales bacterium]|nr:hypothetical protein [Sedimentisphaerales bacterium]
MQTRTAIDIKSKLMVFELLAFTEKTVKSQRLREIIEYCIPRKLLRSIILKGWRRNEIHTRMEITIDYEKDDTTCFTINSDLGTQVMSWSPEGTKQDPCPLWAKTIDWFTKLCKDNNLYLSWFPYFNGPSSDLYKKFGYSFSSSGGGSTVIDKTRSSTTRTAVNSNASSLQMRTQISDEMISNQNYAKE